MSDLEDDRAVAPHPSRGGRLLLAVLAIVAVVAVAIYLLRLPALRHLRFRQEPEVTAMAVPAVAAPADDRLPPLQARVDALAARVAAIEARGPVPAAAAVPDAAVAARLDALSARAERTDAQSSLALAALDTRLRTDEQKLAAAADQAQTVASLQASVRLLNQARAMQLALQQGEPLGNAPGLPPALARYASTAPPTEAQLRLTYPAAAAAGRRAARPDAGRLGFWRAMRARLEGLVTIRRGDRLVAGNPQVAVLDQANEHLGAGDLAGTVALLETLDPAAKAAMAPWMDQATSLLAARAALTRFGQDR